MNRNEVYNLPLDELQMKIANELGVKSFGKWNDGIPKYSEELPQIFAAIIEDVLNSFYGFSLFCAIDGVLWYATFERRKDRIHRGFPSVTAKGDTPAIAMCRAYLFWKYGLG